MQKHYFDGPAVADEYSKDCSAEPSTGAAAAAAVAAAAGLEDYFAGLAASAAVAAAAAASQKSCFVVQSTDLIAWL